MIMLDVLHRIRHWLKVYTSLEHFRVYYHFIEAIATTKGSWAESRRIKCIITFLVLAAFRFLLLVVVPMNQINWITFYNVYDIFGLLTKSKIVNLSEFMLFLMIAYYYYLLYFCNFNYTTYLICRFICNDGRVRFCEDQLGKGRCWFLSWLTKLLLLAQWLGMSFYLAVALFATSNEMMILKLMWQHRSTFFGSVGGWLRVMLSHLNGAVFNMALMFYADACIFLGLLEMCISVIIFYRLVRIRRALLALATGRVPMHVVRTRLAIISKAIAEVLVLFGQVNNVYGRAFMVFIIINGPLSAALVNSILFGSVQPSFKIYVLAFITGEWTYIVGFHLVITFYNLLFHRLGLPLIRLWHRVGRGKHRRHRNMRRQVQWKLMWLIEKIHSKQQYGFAYGRVGLVTTKSFGKFVLIYCKLLIITYKLSIRVGQD